ncbi:MAG TPA: ribonuclease Z [Solirubrobacterales bacterium]|nr:ribonuclease Z [Solirubrobacterales bacterium]
MDLEVTFLGTGASAPSARRSTAAVLVARGGERLLFDCGEGTQRQMQKSLGLTQVDEIYLTHFHADHMLGLPGLLKTYDLTDREAPLRVYGPPGLKDLFIVLRPLIGRLRYPLELGEMKAGERVDHDEYAVEAYEAAHNVRAFGWALVEDERPGRFDPDTAKELGVREGPDFARLQRGEEVEGSQGTVRPDQVMGKSREGRIIVVTGDTAPSPQTVAAAADADLLIHDATFTEEDAQRAAETGHSTLGQAAAVAAEAHVRMLALVHISARYHVGKVLDEAREVFPGCVAPRDFDQIVVPFPERGAPELIQDGARKRGEAAAATDQ